MVETVKPLEQLQDFNCLISQIILSYGCMFFITSNCPFFSAFPLGKLVLGQSLTI